MPAMSSERHEGDFPRHPGERAFGDQKAKGWGDSTLVDVEGRIQNHLKRITEFLGSAARIHGLGSGCTMSQAVIEGAQAHRSGRAVSMGPEGSTGRFRHHHLDAIAPSSSSHEPLATSDGSQRVDAKGGGIFDHGNESIFSPCRPPNHRLDAAARLLAERGRRPPDRSSCRFEGFHREILADGLPGIAATD